MTCSWASNVVLRQIHAVRAYIAGKLSVAQIEKNICVDCKGQRLPSTRHHRCLHLQLSLCHGSVIQVPECLSLGPAMWETRGADRHPTSWYIESSRLAAARETAARIAFAAMMESGLNTPAVDGPLSI